MADEIVIEGQNWLNQTYGGRSGYCYVEPNGVHGSAMSAALVSAMQIELGMSTVTGVFGELTKAACDASPLNEGDTGNRVKILQYGFYNKGYDPGAATGVMTAQTVAVLKKIQQDAGLIGPQVKSHADGLRVGAVLGVDEYVLVPGGNSVIRMIQQDLNANYLSYTGLRACDGHYGRSTNEALIYAIQAEEGMSTSMATGYFGPSTKSYLPDLWQSGQYGMNGTYNTAQIANFTRLAQYALFCVGCNPYSGDYSGNSAFNPGGFSGEKTAQTLTALHAFQQSVGLPVRDMIGLNEWMGMLTSTGNPNRDAAACDCATQLTTPALAQSIVNEDYSIVGRYLTGTVGAGANKRAKNLTRAEMQVIFDAGLHLFCIYQDDADWWQYHDDLSEYFCYDRGYTDAKKAVEAAMSLGVPANEYIFFAVDYDFMEDEVYSKIVPHFKGINDCLSDIGAPYRVGIYSSRNTCGIIGKEHDGRPLSSASFVSGMSTGYSGNLGYPLPSDWAFDQIKEYTNPAGIPIDKDVASGKYIGFNQFGKSFLPERPDVSALPSILTIIDAIECLEDLFYDYRKLPSPDYILSKDYILKGVTNFLRRYQYDDAMWKETCGWIDPDFVAYVESSNPEVFSHVNQYIDGVHYFADSAGGQIDLAHLAATIEGYFCNKVPDYWTGWGGDLATGIQDIHNRDGEDASLDTAYAIIGSLRSQCNYSDLCVDADGINIHAIVVGSTEKMHPLSSAMRTYYEGRVQQRYLAYSESLGCDNDIYAIKAAAKSKLEEAHFVKGVPLNVLQALINFGIYQGEYPSSNAIDYGCEAFARYVVYRSHGF